MLTKEKLSLKINDYYKENEYIHYSNCHEDIEFVMTAVKNNPKSILSIASGLDNCLALLLLDPNEITAIDGNITQIYLCNLKKLAIERLNYNDYLVFLGVKEGDSLKLYESIKSGLDSETRAYFDEHVYLISQIKLVNCGRFEYYFNVFKNKVLPLIHSEKTIQEFFTCKDLQTQRKFYLEKFNNLRFKLMFKIFFSQAIMKKIGRDKEFFKYNKGSLSSMLKSQFENCIFNNLNGENPYLQYVVLNKFITPISYLKEENYNIIKSRISRLKIKKITFEEQIKSGEKYDLMYLSDIFEYMSESKTAELSTPIFNALNSGGQIVFFNMMNTRFLSGNFVEEKVDKTHNKTFYYKDFLCYLKK